MLPQVSGRIRLYRDDTPKQIEHCLLIWGCWVPSMFMTTVLHNQICVAFLSLGFTLHLSTMSYFLKKPLRAASINNSNRFCVTVSKSCFSFHLNVHRSL